VTQGAKYPILVSVPLRSLGNAPKAYAALARLRSASNRLYQSLRLRREFVIAKKDLVPDRRHTTAGGTTIGSCIEGVRFRQPRQFVLSLEADCVEDQDGATGSFIIEYSVTGQGF
jgi:hypothetical protein